MLFNRGMPIRAILFVLTFLLALLSCGPLCSNSNPKIGVVCKGSAGLSPNVPLTIEVQELCGGCNETVKDCSSRVKGNTIELFLNGSVCSSSGSAKPIACPAVCRTAKFACAIPSLAPGDYTIQASGLSDQSIKVLATGGIANCNL
jgi:hypothetical protein